MNEIHKRQQDEKEQAWWLHYNGTEQTEAACAARKERWCKHCSDLGACKEDLLIRDSGGQKDININWGKQDAERVESPDTWKGQHNEIMKP